MQRARVLSCRSAGAPESVRPPRSTYPLRESHGATSYMGIHTCALLVYSGVMTAQDKAWDEWIHGPDDLHDPRVNRKGRSVASDTSTTSRLRHANTPKGDRKPTADYTLVERTLMVRSTLLTDYGLSTIDKL